MTSHTDENGPQHDPIGVPEVNRWARHIRPGGTFSLRLTRRAVLREIALYADIEGYATIPQGTIARRLECSEGTVNRAIKDLEALGLLTIKKEPGGGASPPNLYRLSGAGSGWQPADHRGMEQQGGQQA